MSLPSSRIHNFLLKHDVGVKSEGRVFDEVDDVL